MLPRRLARIVVATLAAVLLAGTARAQIGRVNGVVKGEDGQNLKGATITANNRDFGMTLTATTDDKGRFAMIGLRSGEWRFIAQAPGYSPQGGAMVVRTGGQNPGLNFVLPRSGVAYFGALAGIMGRDLQERLAAAEQLFASRQWDDAIEAYTNILSRAPVLTNLHLQVAAAHRARKDYDAALKAYQDMLTAEPGSMLAPVEIARTWLERGDPARAEAALTAVATQPTATREVFYALGEIRLAAQDAAGAATWFEKAAETDPNWAKPLLQLGHAALARGDRAEAARLLARAADVDPTAPEAATAQSTLATLK